MKKVLVTPRSFGKNDPTLFDQLKAGGFEVVRNDTGAILSEETICRMIADCDAVILGVDPCNKNVLDHAPKLRAIARYGVGLDNIDLEECKKRGISVTRTVGANSNAVADFAFGLMLAVARKIVLGKTLGIIGLGAVGKCVARRAAGFGMKILAADPYFDDKFAQDLGIARASVDEICEKCDFITLHSVLTDETRNLINADRIAKMKKTAILINTARGGLIDEAALLTALREKRIYGAGIDVFSSEPPAEKEWYTLDNIVMGSHTSSSTVDTTNRQGKMCVDALLAAKL